MSCLIGEASLNIKGFALVPLQVIVRLNRMDRELAEALGLYKEQLAGVAAVLQSDPNNDEALQVDASLCILGC